MRLGFYSFRDFCRLGTSLKFNGHPRVHVPAGVYVTRVNDGFGARRRRARGGVGW